MHYMRVRKHGDPNYVQDLTGANNPFFGKTHSDETRRVIAQANRGANNHGWQGGRGTAPYGPAFTKKFKAFIRDRDGHTCQECGRLEGTRAFHVHHRDFDKDNNDPVNLVTICFSCHRRIHPQRRKQKG